MLSSARLGYSFTHWCEKSADDGAHRWAGGGGIPHSRDQHGVPVPEGAARLQALAVPAGVDGVLDPGDELVVPAPEIAAVIDLGVVVEHVRDVVGGITVQLGRVRRHGRLDEVGEVLLA